MLKWQVPIGHQALSARPSGGVALKSARDLPAVFDAHHGQTKETVHLAVLDEDQVLYLDKVEGPHALRMPSRVGGISRLIAVSRQSDALLFGRSRSQEYFSRSGLAALYRKHDQNPEPIAGGPRMIRKRGYSIDNEEIEIGLRCVGAPIRDYTGAMVGAISVAAPSARLSAQKIHNIGKLVVTTAEEISIKLGYEKLIKAKAQ